MSGIRVSEALSVSKANPGARWPERHSKNRLEPECWPVIRPSFTIDKSEPIFTIGSCFARNIEKHLAGLGFIVPVIRFAESEQLDDTRMQAILNRYTPPSIYQELAWTKAILDRDDQVRMEDIEPFLMPVKNGRVVDLQRKLNGRFGLTPEEALQQRQRFYALFKQAFSCPVVIITLGLIECWWDASTGQSVEFDVSHKDVAPDRIRFRRLTFTEAYDYANRAIGLLLDAGVKNVLITTSPIPMARTFTGDDVMVANTYSKSMLRTVAGQIAEERPEVDYFPSYESVMLTRKSEVWRDDLIHVETDFIARIMSRVVESYVGEEAGALWSDEEDLLARFNSLVSHQDWSEARAVHARLTQLTERKRETGLFILNTAEMLLASGDRKGARMVLKGLRESENSDLRMLHRLRLARILEAAGLAAKGQEMRDKSLASLPHTQGIKARIGQLLLSRRTEDALHLMQAAELRETRDPELMMYLGAAYERMGRPEDAERLFRSGHEANPQQAELLAGLCRVLVRAGRRPEAVELANAAPVRSARVNAILERGGVAPAAE